MPLPIASSSSPSSSSASKPHSSSGRWQTMHWGGGGSGGGGGGGGGSVDQQHPGQPWNRYLELVERSMDLNETFKSFLYGAYALILVLGLMGNLLVCYVVLRRYAMRTVTNLFIANLALSDILLCLFAVPFTPLYLLHYKQWVFGPLLCRLVPFFQGVSVYVSVLSLMCIAIERYRVIVHPFRARIGVNQALTVIAFIWFGAFLLTLPYGIFIDVIPIPVPMTTNGSSMDQTPVTKWYCDEVWPSDRLRVSFGLLTCLTQFALPFCIISFCYLRVFVRLWDRLRLRSRGVRNYSSQRLWLEKERARRTNLMLIVMVAIFAVSWLPLNTYNLIEDLYVPVSFWKHSRALFMTFHLIAMSSVCYNPFLYAWLNDNFHKEFRLVQQPLYRLVWLIGCAGGDRSIQPNTAGDEPAPAHPGTTVLPATEPKEAREKRGLPQATNRPDTARTLWPGGAIHWNLDIGTSTSTTNNLVTNLESMNQLELQENLFVTSLHNGQLATRLLPRPATGQTA